MKKNQRNFAVEYKSGRRKVDAKPNSIWGSLDLKSVARDVERSMIPSLSNLPKADEPEPLVSPPKENRVLPTLTAPAVTLIAVADEEEMPMADETEATVNADAATNADAPAAVEAPAAPKKPRRPRMKKGSPEMTADVEVDVERAPGQKRRGRKPKAAGEAAVGKRAPTKRVTQSEQKVVEATSAGDDMADLLQLEEENQRLRKLLAERLRAENADLRKKLKLA